MPPHSEEAAQATSRQVNQVRLAGIQIKDRFGYINKNGEIVIPMRFRQPQDFSEGLACVDDENGQSGFIPRN